MLTGIVLVHDETLTLQKCLQSLNFVDELLAIADQPTSATLSALKKFKIKVIRHPLNNDFSAQHNFALSHARGNWILFIDADEQVSPELAKDIRQAISRENNVGYYLHRVDYLWKHRFKYGDLAGNYLLRLAKNESGVWEGKVHEVWRVSGSISRLSGDLIHTPHATLENFLRSVNNYSTIRARELFAKHTSVSIISIIFYPLRKFIYLWLIKLGFLDGIPGLVHAGVMSFYSFLVRGKLYLLSRGITE